MSATIKQVLLNTADQFEAGDDRHANIIDVLNRLNRVAPNTLDEMLDFAELVTDVEMRLCGENSRS